jgi:site-specific recombinase XerD
VTNAINNNIALYDVFISQYESNETKRAYKRDIEHFFENVKKPSDQVTKSDAISYLQILKDKKLGARSIARTIYAIKSYFKFLINMDVIQKNPMDVVRLPKTIGAPRSGLSDELRKNQKKAKIDKAVFCLMLYNGLRRSEVCGINYGDIKKVNGVYVIEIRGKGGKTRIRPIHPTCGKAIIDYLKQDNRQNGEAQKPIFITSDGKRLESHHVYTIIKRISKLAGIKRNVHPHMLRAKFASMALESGQPITSVQADMGHSSIETTAIYDKAKHDLERSAILGIKEIHTTLKKS